MNIASVYPNAISVTMVSEVGFNEFWSKMDATLQLITDQFRELKSEICIITAELKTNICALGTGQEALRSDIGSIIEDKVGNCMSSITEGLKTEMNDLGSEVGALESKINEGQAEMEERFERQQR